MLFISLVVIPIIIISLLMFAKGRKLNRLFQKFLLGFLSLLLFTGSPLFLIPLNDRNDAAFAAGTDPCATPGKDGIGNLTTIVNTYFAANSGTLSAGVANTTITLGAQGGAATPVAVGDLLMIIQMQDADINSSNSDSYGDGIGGGGGGTGAVPPVPAYSNATAAFPATGASGQTFINNAGRYEFVKAIAVTGGGGTGSTITLKGTGTSNGLNYQYRQANFVANTSGRRSYQIIRVPQYSSLTLAIGAASVVPPWNGTIGGVFAVDIAGQVNFSGQTIDLRGKGFRGGAGRRISGGGGSGSNGDYRTDTTTLPGKNGSKGEGIAGTPKYVLNYFDPSTISFTDGNPTGALTLTTNADEGYPFGSYARGAPGNAGGGSTDGNNANNNDLNSGGGGGSNGGDGGNGGRSFSNQVPTGGYGGKAFTTTEIDNGQRLIMGGGGGAGTTNNGSRSTSRAQTGSPANYAGGSPNSANQRETDTPAGIFSSGGAGGGVVIIRANNLLGSGTIDIRGVAGLSVGRDGAGGGGAGGTAYITANTSTASINVQGSGGPGGFATFGLAHGPGGGGGGGVLVRKTPISGSITSILTGGVGGETGITNNSALPTHGAVAGTGFGLLIDSVDSPGIKSGEQCTPNLTVAKTTSTPTITKPATGAMTATYTIKVTNASQKAPATNVAISDQLPTGFTYLSTTSITLSAVGVPAATRTAVIDPALGSTNPTWGTFTIPEQESVTIIFNVSIPNSQALGTYQNPATATYDDPQKIVAGGTKTATYDPASSTNEDVTIVSRSLNLVKRITAINGNAIATFSAGTPIGNSDANDAKWPSPNTDYLRGAIDCPTTGVCPAPQPNDTIEYTIYFLSNGTGDITNVTICDLVPANTTFVSGVYNNAGSNFDIAFLNSASLQTAPNAYLTGLSDSDRGNFYQPNTLPPTTCKKPNAANPPVPADDLSAIDNTNGLVVVDVAKKAAIPTEILPAATGAGTPANSYGFVRFTVKVN